MEPIVQIFLIKDKTWGVLPLTRGVFLVLLQDSDPLVQAVIGDCGSVVPPGAVVVQHPSALPLHRGDAGPRRRGGIDPGEAENRRPEGDQKHKRESVHGVLEATVQLL